MMLTAHRPSMSSVGEMVTSVSGSRCEVASKLTFDPEPLLISLEPSRLLEGVCLACLVAPGRSGLLPCSLPQWPAWPFPPDC